MSNKRLSLILFALIATSPAVFAAGDPMKSLFLFQQKMADKGNASAMLKMGEMYERGEGVEKNNENALKMYEQANAKGNKKAKIAIQRLKNSKNKSSNKKRIAEQKKIKQQAIAAEKKRKQREAVKEAKTKQLAKDKANKEAKAKAAAKTKAAKQAKAKAAKARAAKAKAEKDAKAKARKAKAAKDAKAKAAAKEKAKAARIAAEKRRQESKNSKEGFKSDPCKGKAARFSSLCK